MLQCAKLNQEMSGRTPPHSTCKTSPCWHEWTNLLGGMFSFQSNHHSNTWSRTSFTNHCPRTNALHKMLRSAGMAGQKKQCPRDMEFSPSPAQIDSTQWFASCLLVAVKGSYNYDTLIPGSIIILNLNYIWLWQWCSWSLKQSNKHHKSPCHMISHDSV